VAIVVIADAHLGGFGGGADELVRQLDALPGEGCRRLILLGDIFHVWIGSPQFETPEIVAVVAALRRLRAAGVRLDYIEGNRDFFLTGGRYAALFDFVGSETSFAAGGKRILAVHGDGLNDRDWRYRFWRWLSKSTPVRYLVLHLPARWARRLVRSTEARLAGTNFKHRQEIPEAAIRAYAERRLREGYDQLILGHFHEERQFSVPGGDVWLLDAWFRAGRVERFDD
jgi:UDP-2,3-diacylglucosamine hydrolase